MSQKRKALESRNVVIDKDSVAQYAKKARTWCESIVSQGLNSLWNGLGLKPLEELAQQQRQSLYCIGAFPDDFRFSKESQWRTNHLSDEGDNSTSWSEDTRSSHSRISRTIDNDSSQESSPRYSSGFLDEGATPYSLGPFSLSPHLRGDAASAYNLQSELARVPVANSHAHSRFYRGYRSQHIDSFSPVHAELRPRIHSGKVSKRMALLQNKYYKDESTALNRLTSRYASASAVSQYKRADYVAAVNQSMGVSETDNLGSSDTPRTDVNARSSTVPFYDDRFRKYGRLQNLFDEQQSDQENKPPAWTRTRKQTPRWQINLDRFRSLIAKNLPSINKQDLSPAHQAAVDKHEEIERELEKRRGRKHFRPISDDDRQKINQALSDGYGPVAEGFNVTITKNDIRTLRPGEWLNDEVINFYGNLIMARSNASNTLPKVHVFSTFFYKTLSENGYDKVRRWTKKTNIFEKDYILIPIHCSGNHWTSAVIDMTKKKISYYDSLLGNNPKCFLTLRAYLEKESLDKLKKPFDFQGWENECPKNIPQQRNGYDCGVFTCFFIEFKSRGEDTFDFSQADMPYLRQKMVLDIVNKVLAE